MNQCYKFDNIEFEHGLFNDCLDATYIIHLEGNGRLSDIKTQLYEYQPTNKVHILFNKGIKCDKNIPNNIPPKDLVHAYFECFEDAEKNAYRNILILEDDFTFSEKIKEREHVENICKFIKTKEEEPIIYRLGCIPFCQIPCSWDYKHFITVFSGGTHSVIYTKMYRDELLQLDKNTITDWDDFNNWNKFYCYTYYTPLCYQLFPETENSKYWGIENPVFHFLGKILFSIYQFFGLNENVEPGYSFFYMFSKIIFFVLVAICFCIFIFIIRIFIPLKFKLKNEKMVIKNKK